MGVALIEVQKRSYVLEKRVKQASRRTKDFGCVTVQEYPKHCVHELHVQ